jgi:hypothetical protein
MTTEQKRIKEIRNELKSFEKKIKMLPVEERSGYKNWVRKSKMKLKHLENTTI